MNEIEFGQCELTFEPYAQRMDIEVRKMAPVIDALMDAGYQVLCCKDGESQDIVIIEFVHPKFTGHRFAEEEI